MLSEGLQAIKEKKIPGDIRRFKGVIHVYVIAWRDRERKISVLEKEEMRFPF